MRAHSIREKRCFRHWLNITEKTTFYQEWYILPWKFGIEAGIANYECAISISLRLVLFSIHVSINNAEWERWLMEKTKREDETYGSGRIIGMQMFNYTLWIDLWRDPMEWRSEDPWWWHFNIDFREILFGKSKSHFNVINQGDSVIIMPEGAYPCTYKVKTYFHERPRWFIRTHTIIDVNIPLGIPIEGKGENSWDCGMDATYGMSMPFSKYDGICQSMDNIALDMLKRRQRRGSLTGYKYPEEACSQK